MQSISNLTSIDDLVLQIDFLVDGLSQKEVLRNLTDSGAEADEGQKFIDFVWSVTSLNSTELVIQINFTNPFFVSTSSKQFDQLVVTFLQSDLFLSKEGSVMLPDQWTMTSQMPTQGFISQMEVVEELISVVETIQIVVFSSNVVVNSLSMKALS